MHDRLSRRRVITGLAAASAATIAGCGSPGDGNETSPEESPAEGESPTESPMGGGEETTESPMGGGEETTESPMGGGNETESPMANETESPMGNETEPGETTTANETDGGLLE
jgi:hypothetical protein